MPAVNDTSKRRPAVIFAAFIFTCLAHALMIFAAAWILRTQVEAIDWKVEWREASMLGTLAVVWRMWLKPRN